MLLHEEQSGRFLRRPKQDYPAATVAEFCTAVLNGVGVTLAHQHIVQADRAVFESIIGNVGSILAFRVGALDAPTVAQQMQGVQASDLINQPNYRAFAQIMIAGEKTKPFSMTTRP